MLTGLTNDIRDIDGARKTAVISRELFRLKVDIAALQETRTAGCGSLTEKEYTFFWQGRDEDEPRVHGVGFAVSNKLVQMVEPGSTKSERIMHIKLNTDLGPTNLLSVYAPTLTSSTDAKDTFYSQLDDAIKHIPNNEVLILLGDFNARVGNDQGSWPDCLGHFGVGKCNENGQRLLELCTYHHLYKVSNNEVLARANIPSMFTLIRQRRLRWLGHVYRMEDGRIPKDLLYGELESGSRPIGRPKLRFKDVCKRDMLATGLPTDNS
ncbi:craniofacial development protein 2-like [Stylophora pistillata]|uniref:craniofacial development protein 2-like n=1 Tax=Stylophora pistillata TaxID=50429 RepID=UPI000C03AC8D|nr:craniofacial development protein 2-like [Stylophora pistillata]